MTYDRSSVRLLFYILPVQKELPSEEETSLRLRYGEKHFCRRHSFPYATVQRNTNNLRRHSQQVAVKMRTAPIFRLYFFTDSRLHSMLQYLSVDIRHSNTVQTFFTILIKLPVNILHDLTHSRGDQARLIHITASPR